MSDYRKSNGQVDVTLRVVRRLRTLVLVITGVLVKALTDVEVKALNREGD